MREGLADNWGATRVPLYVLNVTYPLVDAEIIRFCSGKRAVLVVEEGQPDFIEQALARTLRDADLPTRVLGKRVLPMAGEYTVEVLEAGLRRFMAAAGLTSALTPRGKALSGEQPRPHQTCGAIAPLPGAQIPGV